MTSAGVSIELKGYGTRVRLDGTVLTVEATNSLAKGALGAAARTIQVGEIEAVSMKPASMMTNGQIRIQSGVGLTLIHFLKKASPDANALYEALLASASADPLATPTGRLANEGRDAFQERAKARIAASQLRLEESRRTRDEEYAKWQATHQANREQYRRDIEEARWDLASVVQPKVAAVQSVLDAAEREFVPEIVEGVDEDFGPAPSTAAGPPVEQQVSVLLGLAEQAASVGDVELEELRIEQAKFYAKKLGTRADRAATDKSIASRIDSGKLYVNSKLLGEIKAENGFAQRSRKGSWSRVVPGEQRIVLRTDRITSGQSVRAVDEFTSAQVYLDGQEQITQRPTLTRMALLSPLPGLALAPALALQKKTVNDMREAEFQVGSVGWSFRASIAPKDVNLARQLAEQVNKVAAGLESQRQIAGSAEAGISAVPSETVEAAVAQLERLAFLLDKGIIEADDMARMKRLILE